MNGKRDRRAEDRAAVSRLSGRRLPEVTAPAAGRRRRAFVDPELSRHEPLTRITLVSDFGGSGGGQGTFFG